MGRGRISMELIPREKSRKITFQKRKGGLLKKVEEFAVLCDVDVCLILYAPKFEGQGYDEPETWPTEIGEVRRILKKYYNTTPDRRTKVYDAQEYFKERMKKVEFDISKVRKERLKIMYPTWDESLNSLKVEQIRLMTSTLDAKLDSCNQKMNMLRGDIKGKAIAHDQSPKVDKPNAPCLTLTPNSYSNFMQNNMSQAQIYPPSMNTSDKNPLGFWPLQLGQPSQPSSSLSSAQGSLGFWPLQLGQSSQPSSSLSSAQGSLGFWPLQLGQSSHPSSSLSSAQGSYQVDSTLIRSDEGRYSQSYPNKQVDSNWANWISHTNANIFLDPKTDMKKKDEAENVENLSTCYYNGGNPMTMQSYPIGMQSHGYQHNGFYDMDILRGHMVNNYYMDGRK